MERRAKVQVARETERECVREGEWLKMKLASVVKTVVGRRTQHHNFYTQMERRAKVQVARERERERV